MMSSVLVMRNPSLTAHIEVLERTTVTTMKMLVLYAQVTHTSLSVFMHLFIYLFLITFADVHLKSLVAFVNLVIGLICVLRPLPF